MTKTGFTGNDLDRTDPLRLDPDALQDARRRDDALVVRLNGLDPVVDDRGRLVWDKAEDGDLIFLGLDGEAPRFAAIATTPPVGQRPGHLFRLIAEMDARDAAIWGTVRGLLEWHNRTRFCGVCGGRPAVFRGGWGRKCPDCNAEHFPRVDPVVIMIAEHEGRALLGRQPGFPPRRYSALAGFLEPGESIEEAVSRELKEEAGVVTTSVRYIASQPWPFPHSLMIGCAAPVAEDRITLDTHELEDADWFTQDEVLASLAGEEDARFIAPPPYALAYTLLTRWANG